jgi:gluconokinase
MPNLIVIMGVSGCGKSVVGAHLRAQLEIEFIDGDDLHSQQNVEKMSAGIALTDADRQPWLQRIGETAEASFALGNSLIVACSALKARYRDVLREVSHPVLFLHLRGSAELIASRLSQRQGHYMPVELLQSQFNDLEDPAGESNVISIDIQQELPKMLSSTSQQVASWISQQ